MVPSWLLRRYHARGRCGRLPRVRRHESWRRDVLSRRRDLWCRAPGYSDTKHLNISPRVQLWKSFMTKAKKQKNTVRTASPAFQARWTDKAAPKPQADKPLRSWSAVAVDGAIKSHPSMIGVWQVHQWFLKCSNYFQTPCSRSKLAVVKQSCITSHRLIAIFWTWFYKSVRT